MCAFVVARKNQDCVADLSLAFFVRRLVDNFATDKHRCRAAAIQIHRFNSAEFEKHLGKFLQIHTDARSGLSAVNRYH